MDKLEMEATDLKLLSELERKAIDSNWYDLADCLHDAYNTLKKQLEDESEFKPKTKKK